MLNYPANIYAANALQTALENIDLVIKDCGFLARPESDQSEENKKFFSDKIIELKKSKQEIISLIGKINKGE